MNQESMLSFSVRSRVKETIKEELWHWKPGETAVLVVDMWDQHWCKGATFRVKQIAERMNPVLQKVREKGISIIHCPSDTMKFYKKLPQRKRIARYSFFRCKFGALFGMGLQEFETPFPIDDRDGGCFCEPKCIEKHAWSRQIPTLDIAPNDCISDNGCEIARYTHARGIKNLIYMGVHTNMCVLGRSFGIRRMKQRGFSIILCRDLTDSMYNPASWPHVTHDEGTQLVIDHIERYWCPTILSSALL